MKTICVINLKGGTAKTTTAVSVAAALALDHGQRVLLVDLDPQANASSWYGLMDPGAALCDALTDDTPLDSIVQSTRVPGVELVPASAMLAMFDRRQAGRIGAEICLRKALARLPRDRWDYIVLDCLPTLCLLSISALVAADEVLVPVEAQALAAASLVPLHQAIEQIRDAFNPTLRMGAILVCRVRTGTKLSKEVITALREHYGGVVLDTTVRENTRIGEAWSHQQPITMYAPSSAGAIDYEAATAELLARWTLGRNHDSEGTGRCAA